MRRFYTVILICLLVSCSAIFLSFESKHLFPNDIAKERLLKNIDEFSQAVARLEEAASKNENNLAEHYLACRKSLKQAEFLLAYLQPEYTIDHINGAPLPKLERKVTAIVVLEPTGMQRIDELVFEEEQNKPEIARLAGKLKHQLDLVSVYLNEATFTDRQVFEAMRSELVRLFTLGVTGFDTPASGSAMADALEVMKSLKEAYTLYNDELLLLNPNLAVSLNISFQEAITYLEQNNDFDTFDRLTFLKQYVNPLYKDLLAAHLNLNIETLYDVNAPKASVNYLATNIFADDFLDPYFYTSLQPSENNKTVENLGRILFFDPILSANGKRSCASCHKPDMGFTDGMAKSMAFDFKGTVDRNAPTLINAVYADRYFLDMRAAKLEEQIEHVVISDKEFHTDFNDIAKRLGESDAYRELFAEAFPKFDDPVFKYTISMALSAYMVSLTGFNSEFDKYVRGENEEIAANVKNGFNLFMGKAACGTCHFAPLFSGCVPPAYTESESEVLGVPANADKLSPLKDEDLGRMASKRLRDETEIYKHSFKTVTLRNIALTAPYMHNGVYNTLEEVMDFYHGGGGAGLGFDLPNQTLASDSLVLTEPEKQDIIAFMRSLTYTTGMTQVPTLLPEFAASKNLKTRKIGGEY